MSRLPLMPLLAGVALLAGTSVFLAGTAAQAQQKPLSLPPPPSASDPLPKSDAPARGAKPRKAEAKKAGAQKARAKKTAEPYEVGGPAPSRSSVTDRIDNRGPAGRPMELEDDPRAMQPVMQNGRAGMGMRF